MQKIESVAQLKEVAKKNPQHYTDNGVPSHRLANMFILFKKPRSEKIAITIRIPVPEQLQLELKKKNETRTLTYAEQDPLEFLSTLRSTRDELYQRVYGKSFGEHVLSKLKASKPKNQTGKEGVGFCKTFYKFSVSYELDGKSKICGFSLFEHGSEDAAFIEACTFSDLVAGNPVAEPDEYLRMKGRQIFPEFGTEELEEKLTILRELKENTCLPKEGVELVSNLSGLGFYANFSTDVGNGRGQRRVMFNAQKLTEDEAYLSACREVDKRNGNPVLDDKSYLAGKPQDIFKGLL